MLQQSQANSNSENMRGQGSNCQDRGQSAGTKSDMAAIKDERTEMGINKFGLRLAAQETRDR